MAKERMLVCQKCGRRRQERYFFKKKDGERSDICTDCLTMYIDNYDDTTFEWILEKFDVPYVKDVWVKMANEAYLKNPQKFNGKSVLGKYVRSMNMHQYKEMGYADSDKINFEKEQAKNRRRKISDKDQEYIDSLQKQLDEGEITEAQFKTLAPQPEQEFDTTPLLEERPIEMGVDEGTIRGSMSDEEYQYLLMKWGHLYQPSQLVYMEKLYNKYEGEYELNVDREDTLKKICKTSLKMDEALDVGDIQTYQKLANVSDQLRKSGKFTEAQNKEEQERYLDSIGELVELCENEGGPIKEFVDPDEYPQDKIDFTIKDLKSYNYNLIMNELHLGELIQSYIDKLEKANEEDSRLSLEDGLKTSSEEEVEEEVSDKEAVEFQEYLDTEIEKDAQMLLEAFGGE